MEAANTQALGIGSVSVPNRVFFAPMSGVTDLPFRRLAHRLGAGLVVSEMVASEELVARRRDVLRRTLGRDLAPFAIQLAGREARWMAEGARISEGLGADIIDINMGCPAREVTGKLSGSALMRNLDHALSLIEAVVAAVKVPVTLKMRLGWDEKSINAPQLAKRAEAAGVRLITVHARTRCQFFKGQADWSRIAEVKSAVTVPVVVNGDICSTADARRAIAASGADAVMIGRGGYGAPWMPRLIANDLVSGTTSAPPTLHDQRTIALEHIEAMLLHYGRELGLRNARKHICWYLEKTGAKADIVKTWRRRLCTNENAETVLNDLARFYTERGEAAA